MIEASFKSESSNAKADVFVNLGFVGILVYHSFLFTDYFIITDYFYSDVIIHIVFTPTILLLMYFVNKRIVKPEPGLVACLVLVVTTIIMLTVKSQAQFSGFLIFTIPLVMCFGNLLLPLPFRESLWFTGFCLMASAAGVFLRSDWQTALTPFALMINTGTASYMLFASHRAETTERRAYLFGLRERLRADKLSSDLAQQQAVLRSILDAGPDAMLLFDSHGTISSFSYAAEQLFKQNAQVMTGQNIESLIAEAARPAYYRHFRDYIDSGERRMISNSVELTGIRHDGSTFPMMIHLGEVLLGARRQFTGIIHDLTALQEAHDRSQDLRTQLAHVWSMNSLGEMAAILAHELNQPLSAITNYMQGARKLLGRHPDTDGDLLSALDQTAGQALRAGEIIRRMRSLVANTDKDHRKESIRALISEIDFMVRLVVREADVKVRYHLSSEPDFVYADRIQIQQVITNLVRNACEAMSGYPQRLLEISTRSDENSWTVVVDDSGPGIPPEIMEKLFVPLATTKPKGMGLGLAVSRAIINSHQGELWVGKSAIGGASFGFSIPRLERFQPLRHVGAE